MLSNEEIVDTLREVFYTENPFSEDQLFLVESISEAGETAKNIVFDVEFYKEERIILKFIQPIMLKNSDVEIPPNLVRDFAYEDIPASFVFTYKQYPLTLGDFIKDTDKDLIEEHAPRLFNTYSDNNLKDVMRSWVELFYNYRVQEMQYKYYEILGFRQHYEKSSIPSKKDKNRQEESFKASIQGVINFLGTENLGTEKGEKLRKTLQEVLNDNPNDYIPKNANLNELKPKKTPIKEYLKQVLGGETNAIKNFLNALA